MRQATARAPGTTGNAAVGFDLLGFASDALFDHVTVRAIDEPTVRIARVSDPALPLDPAANTAGVALQQLCAHLKLPHGFEVEIDKGIPLGSGLGGSAASAVGAVVAAAALLDAPLSHDVLFRFALAGEAVSSGHAHPDNVAPCLYGGLTLTVDMQVRQLPTPPGVEVALIHPDISIRTRDARAVMPQTVPMPTVVQQMGYLAAFVDACHRGDAVAAGGSCRDLLAEPHRKSLLPGFDAARAAAHRAGALAFSLSGSGPTVFALAELGGAAAIGDAVVEAFQRAGLTATAWTSAFGTAGAEVI